MNGRITRALIISHGPKRKRTVKHENPEKFKAFVSASLSPTARKNRPCARAFGLRCQHHRKRESQHHVTGCGAWRIRLHSQRHSARRTTGDRRAAHRKSDRRRDDLLRGQVWWSFSVSGTDSSQAV